MPPPDYKAFFLLPILRTFQSLLQRIYKDPLAFGFSYNEDRCIIMTATKYPVIRFYLLAVYA
jgi:hypothetical protein